ncbi:hypothetical protein WOLCODRAFT_20520 [Wolfiporia cocos MD-104 SS10]|uniref:Uncharacterized protein n=1 Tax=Wolfiporia cocos (strain MD-104) TaxID=742152 RepID=A0A2H3J404_WOLCO|nr:hypothetical protein WOLCODRAFT_20520 [Wolfiporia cocos MD-104 SS10]
MSAHGFGVTPHYLDLPTAWRGVFAHAPAGKAEEKMRAISIMCYPGGGPANWSSIGPSLASQHLIVEIFGYGLHSAHAAWEAQNALDAAFLAYSSMSVLRQQIKPTHRVHGIVSGKDWAPNNAVDLRAPTWAELEVLRERVKKCFECVDASSCLPRARVDMGDPLRAAAHATGCKVAIDTNSGYCNVRQNQVLGEQCGKVVERYGIDYGVDEGMSASTDFGNVSYALPSLHPAYTIPTKPNGGDHTPRFTWAAGTAEAHALTIKKVKGLAATGFHVLDDEAFTVQVRKAWEEQMKA